VNGKGTDLQRFETVQAKRYVMEIKVPEGQPGVQQKSRHRMYIFNIYCYFSWLNFSSLTAPAIVDVVIPYGSAVFTLFCDNSLEYPHVRV
jgi:hypothetical protein